MTDENYSIDAELEGEFSEVLERVKSAFQEQGFGVLTEIDVKKTLKEKMGKELGYDYVILGICNPPIAHSLLKKERDVGLVLPCNVIVYDDKGKKKVVVKAMNPETALGIFSDVGEIDCEAREKIVEAIKSLRVGTGGN